MTEEDYAEQFRRDWVAEHGEITLEDAQRKCAESLEKDITGFYRFLKALRTSMRKFKK